MQILAHELYLLLHGTLLVLKVSDTVMVVLVLPLEASLAPSAVDVVLVALGIDVYSECLPGELLGAV